MPEFKLLIDRLTDMPQHFEFEAPARWWSARVGDEEAVGDARVERPFGFGIEANRRGECVSIEGTLVGGISVECSRCTRRYAHALRDSFRLVLEPLVEDMWGDERAREAIDPEGERAIAENGICLGDDLEAGWFRGPVIYLDDFFAEVVATAMPIQPLCDEDCPGLCPHCGMEKGGVAKGVSNEPRGEGAMQASGVCDCADERIESPFAVLAAWKASGQGNGQEESKSTPGHEGLDERTSGKIRTKKGSGSGQRR